MKRYFIHGNQNVNSKKRKVENINIISKIIIRHDHDPHVYINIDYSYVRIGNFVYKTKRINNEILDEKKSETDCDSLIGLTATQYDDLYPFTRGGKIIVSGYNKNTYCIDKICIQISTPIKIRYTIYRESLNRHIVNVLNKHIVSVCQNISICYQDLVLKIHINNIDNNNILLGKITKNTEISYDEISENLIIYDQCINLDSKSIKIEIIGCTIINNMDEYQDLSEGLYFSNSVAKFPLIIEWEFFGNYIKNVLNYQFIANDILKFIYDNFEFTIRIIVTNVSYKKFQSVYSLLMDDELIPIISLLEHVIIIKTLSLADKIYFNILSSKKSKYHDGDYILPVDKITTYLKENVAFVAVGQIIQYPLDELKFVELEVKHILPKSDFDVAHKVSPYFTKFSFSSGDTKFILVRNNKPIDIKEITFKLKLPPQKPIDIFFGTCTKDKIETFDIEKLEKVVRNVFPDKTAIGQKVKITYNGKDYMVSVDDIVFISENENTSNRYTTYGLITSSTKFNFKTRNNETLMINNTTSCDIKNPIKYLEKKVGGLTKELKIVVRTLCLSRGRLRKEYKLRGMKPIRGIILYGPPGTGKTTIARRLGKILGCEGDRFKLMSGPEIFNKYVGQSEANVRNIFKPAKNAWKRFGDDSPTYMVVIDEIDAMLPVRTGGDHPVRDSVTNQFLAELDGLEQFNNFICIGITNRFELIDPAILRSGRFSVHIKIDIPDQNGRTKIFKIHTKKIRKNDRMETVNFEKLSQLTEKFTGADIESVVELASTYSLERLEKYNTLDDDTIKECKIKEEDLIMAIGEVKLRIFGNEKMNDKINAIYI